MVLQFSEFMRNLVGGSDGDPNLPPYSRSTPVPPQMPVQGPPMPVQGPPMPVQGPPIPQQVIQQPVVQLPQRPVQGPVQTSQIQHPMTPQQFSQYTQQGMQQGPQAPMPAQQGGDRDLGGTWVTVQYQYNGMTYNLLVPESNAMNLPQGAIIIPNGTITDEPDRVQRAIDAGEQGVRGQTFIGTLDQAPPEIQGLFRSSEDVYEVSQQRPVERSMPTDQQGVPIPYDMIPDERDWSTTEVPVLNAQGQDANAVQQDQQDFDQFMQGVNQRGVEESITLENAGPALTTEALRQTDPVKAGMLEEAGIFEVRADQMVIQDANGLRLVPVSDQAPEGATIITYGGDTPTPGNRGWGGLVEVVGDVLDLMEVPQRWSQAQYVNIFNSLPAPLQNTIGWLGENGFLDANPMTNVGAGAFVVWMAENPEEAEAARTGGYNGFTGERAVWERFQADRNAGQRALDSVFTDPLNILPSMGSPVRGAANLVGRAARGVNIAEDANVVRRGIGYTDEAVDVLNAADNVAVNSADNAATGAGNIVEDFANAPTVVNDASTTATRGTGYIDNNGQLVVRPGQVIDTPVTVTSRSGRQIALEGGEDILNLVADVLDLPENALGAIVDFSVGLGRGIGDFIGQIPTGDGRRLSDIFDVTNSSAVRDAEEDAITRFEDVRGRRTNIQEGPDIPEGIPEVVDEFPNRLPDTPERGPVDSRFIQPRAVDDLGRIEVSGADNRLTRPEPRPNDAPLREGRQELDLSTDRSVDDLGRTPDQTVDNAQQQLAVDRPSPQSAEEIASVRDAQFLSTPEGRYTKKVLDRIPEEFAFLRPQTAMSRNVGEGRLDEAFALRPADSARELATEHPEKWRAFLDEYDRGLRRRGGTISNEQARRATKAADLNLQSSRFPDQRENGIDVRSTWEVLNEADHLVNMELPIFNKHFGDVVEAPEYQWKRWGTSGNSHTALDTIEQNGGRYLEGMPLHEATEVAIFHPDDNVRISALQDITWRTANRDSTGRAITNRVHSSAQKALGKDYLSGARNARRSIRNLRDNYWAAIDANAAMDRNIVSTARQADNVVPEQMIPADDPNLAQAREAVDAVNDPIGAEVADLTEAATAIADVPADVAAQPLALPERAEAPAISLYGPKYGPNADEVSPLVGAPNVPEGPAARSNKVRTRQQKIMLEDDLRALTDYRAQKLDTRVTDAVDEAPRTARQEYLSGRTRVRRDRMAQTGQTMAPDELASYYVRGRSVGETEAKFFSQKFRDGETLVQRWDRYTVEELDRAGGDVLQAEDLAASRVVNDYVAEVMPDDMRKVYDREYQRALRGRVEDDAGKMVNRTPLEAQIKAMENARRVASPKFLRGYDRFMSAVRKTFLYNWLTGPRYIATQWVGNAVTALVTKQGDVLGDGLSRDTIERAWKARLMDGDIPESVMDEVSRGYGLTGPRDVTRGTAAVRDQTLETAASAANKKGNSLLGKMTAPIADKRIRDMAGAMDRIYRESLWGHVMDQNLGVAKRTLRERMLATVPNGMDAADVSRVLDSMPTRFSSDDLRDAFPDANARWVDRHARDWQESITKTDKQAKAEVKRIFFDGDERNADVAMKRVLFFHYWMSRSVPLYTGAIARDPVMLYNFAQMIDETANDDDLSGTKFFKLMQSPYGFNILIRPDSFFATFATMMDDAGYESDGESRLWKIMEKSPVMVNPMIQTVMNTMGLAGDTFGPDPLGTNKFSAFAGNVIDQANSRFGWDLPNPANMTEVGWRKAREYISGKLDPIPGFAAIPYTDPNGYRENEIRSIVAEIALERGLDLDDPIVQQAMIDPESDMYQEAFRRSTNQDTWDIVSRIIPVSAVLYPKSQLASPRERTRAINEERATQEQLGIGTTDRASELYQERNIIAADSEYSRSMQLQEQEYRNLGTPEQRGAYQFYNNIRYGSLEQDVIISGQMWSAEDVNGMDDAQREQLADTWLEETGNGDLVESYREERATFRDEHPEFAEYVSWQGQMRDYPGGIQEWWADTIEGNPNAARYWNGLTEEERANDRNLTSLEAYFAFSGENLAYWEPEPTATRTEVDPRPYNPIESIDGGSGSGSGSSGQQSQQRGPTKESIAEQAQEYQAQLNEYNAAASQMLGQQVSVDQMNPMARRAVEQNLESNGINKPYMGRDLYDYLQWADAQQGGDTTVGAYLSWYATQNPQSETAPST